MDTAVQFPKTNAELAELGPGLVRFPGSWDEYWKIIDVVEYRVEFQDNEIIAMSYESDPRSRIVSTLQHILDTLESTFPLAGQMIALSDIYRKVLPFSKNVGR